MTLHDSLLAAIKMRREHPSRWDAFHAPDMGPSVAEETALNAIPESVGIPHSEWGKLCFLAESFRKHHIEKQLGEEAEAQIEGAERFLDLEAKDFLHWPWTTLDHAIGGMAPGTLHYIVCPSKGGKTTLCRSAVAEWCKQGKKVLYGGFEMKAETLRTMYAADDAGLDPGDVLTGAWRQFDHYEEVRARMVDAYAQQRRPDHWYSNLRFTGYERVGPKEIREMMEQAASWGADAVVVDHVDHVGGSPGKNEFSVSVETNHTLLELAQKYRLKVIITSQTNQTGKAMDRWRDHKPLRDEVVRFGDVKKQVATTMMGFFRPVRPGLTKEDKEMVEYGEKSMSDVLLSGANRFNVIASRAYGSRIGMTGVVGWERGRIVEPSQALLNEIQAAKHNIKTARG